MEEHEATKVIETFIKGTDAWVQELNWKGGAETLRNGCPVCGTILDVMIHLVAALKILGY